MPPHTGSRTSSRLAVPRLASSGLAASLLLVLGGCSCVLGTANAGILPLEASSTPGGEIALGAKLAGWALGGPLDVAVAPLGLLVWASPWGDLPLFADVATAPSIGLGYGLEALVGGPAAGLARLLGSDPAPASDLAPVASAGAPAPWRPETSALPWGLVVEHRAAAWPARPARPLDPADVAAYAVPDGAAAALAAAVASAQARQEDDAEPVTTSLVPFGWAGDLEVSWADADEPRPLVLLTPPSQGTYAARYLARRYARRGFHAAVLVPDGDYLVPGLDASGLEAKLRAGLVAARTVVAALGASPRVSRTVYLGISAGGIVGSLLLAVEPRVERAALVFPGGDIARIAETSDESTVRAFRESWSERGVDPTALRAWLAATVSTEPLRLAPAIDPGRVLVFLADADTLVPLPCGLSLREALGEPETWLISGEHEVAGCSFGFILRESDAFLFPEETP